MSSGLGCGRPSPEREAIVRAGALAGAPLKTVPAPGRLGRSRSCEILHPKKLPLQALEPIQQLGIRQPRESRSIGLGSWSLDDGADRLEHLPADGRGRQPICIGDLGDLAHGRAASLELVQHGVSHPGRDDLQRKRLIKLHVTSLMLKIVPHSGWQIQADKGQDAGFSGFRVPIPFRGIPRYRMASLDDGRQPSRWEISTGHGVERGQDGIGLRRSRRLRSGKVLRPCA